MSHNEREDGEVGASSVDIPATPSSHYQQPDSDENSRPSSSSTQLSLDDTHPSVKCLWCQEELKTDASEKMLPAEALRLHMESAHPGVSGQSEHTTTHETGDNILQGFDQLREPRQFTYGQIDMGVDERMKLGWKFHDVRNFTKDYAGEKQDLDSIWKTLFDGFDRPQPYESERTVPGSFLRITDPDIHVDLLKDPHSHSTDELYTITANAAKALEVWQDEYLALDELSRWATRRVLKKTVDPRKTEDPTVFEDKKEARLYGYKYDSRPSKIGSQNPFLQGGYKPTSDQMKKMAATATDPHNIDGWMPVIKDGVEYVPRIRPPPPPEPKRKVDVTAMGETEHGRNGIKRITRYGGSKRPVTREGSQALTEKSSPASSIATRAQSPEVLVTPLSSYANQMRRKTRSGAYNRKPAIPSLPVSKTTRSRVTKPSTLGPNRARGAPASAPVTGITTTATTRTPSPVPGPFTTYDDPLLDPKNQMKIQKSKHPKRTEAMIRHWAKFNSEGRTRNPKRTKAQIEADRAADGAAEVPQSAAPGKKRKLDVEREQVRTTVGTPASKKQRRQAAKPKAGSEMCPAMRSVNSVVPPQPSSQKSAKCRDSTLPQPIQNGQ
ncbi:hypothetical protein PRK78_004349 [Emydomyces testavorans]|uniref:Uncharacterized protein n=1 Tax=Emydomyces testavorans TaxID=2070801 RepID=A0AAF0DK24_9EURO|nr:hypothetical protein PRK78_004349 [Emydomyces testavorans]